MKMTELKIYYYSGKYKYIVAKILYENDHVKVLENAGYKAYGKELSAHDFDTEHLDETCFEQCF